VLDHQRGQPTQKINKHTTPRIDIQLRHRLREKKTMDFESAMLLCDVETPDEWFTELESQVSRLGFGKTLLGLIADPKASFDSAFIVSNYPSQWREAYDRANYAVIDPTVQHCMASVLPIRWSEQIYKSDVQLEFREEASAHGLINGLTFPMHGPQGQFGTFSLSVDMGDEETAKQFIQHHWATLSLVKDTALAGALKFVGTAKKNVEVSLTNREREVLQWSAIGKTNWEISNICNCSEATVDFHFKNIRRKLGVSTRSAAAVLALSMKIISI
jgi:LuxR family quorum-sensing transcriptional regulator LasR